MSFDEAARAIDNVSRVKPHWLVITGGEPFLHPDLFRIVERAHNRSMKVSITTNGTLIEERFDELKKAGVDVVSISLDGQDAAHDFLRGRDGTAERVRRGIIKLHEAGQTLSVNYVVTNRNVEDLPAVYAWVSSLGIPFDFWPVNYDRTLGRLNGEQVRMYEAFARMLKNKGVISRAAYEYHMNARFYVREETVLRVRCLGLSRSFGVLVNGDILPCCVWGREYRGLGNVFKDEMDVLWHSQPFFEARQRLYAHGCSAGCYNSCLHEFSAVTGERCLLAAGPRKAQR